MINFYVLTLFPEMILQGLNHSIIKRAIQKELININAIDIRAFSKSKHKKVDDYIYGGGAGMLLKPEPIFDAFIYAQNIINSKNKTKVIYMSPQGKTLNQSIAKTFAKEQDLIILCGHYEGIDERIIEEIVTDEISIGDYILTGGELASMVFIDCVSRLIPSVLSKKESFINESFENSLLEPPSYTRPFCFKGKKVPDILLSGNHKKIESWKHENALITTLKKRPDLLKKANLNNNDLDFLINYIKTSSYI